MNSVSAPYQRLCSEKVTSDFLANTNAGMSLGQFALIIPPTVADLTAWMEQLMQHQGFTDWPSAIKALQLPTQQMPWFPATDCALKKYTPRKTLYTALVLAMCNQTMYNPHLPPVFTQNRLTRKIKLIQLKPSVFYGLD